MTREDFLAKWAMLDQDRPSMSADLDAFVCHATAPTTLAEEDDVLALQWPAGTAVVLQPSPVPHAWGVVRHVVPQGRQLLAVDWRRWPACQPPPPDVLPSSFLLPVRRTLAAQSGYLFAQLAAEGLELVASSAPDVDGARQDLCRRYGTHYLITRDRARTPTAIAVLVPTLPPAGLAVGAAVSARLGNATEPGVLLLANGDQLLVGVASGPAAADVLRVCACRDVEPASKGGAA